MEFEIGKNTLHDALYLTQGVVERRNTLPILSNVLIDAGDSGLRLLATDLDVSIRLLCSATVKTPGTTTLSARKLYEITGKLKGEEVRVRSVSGGGIEVSSGRFKSRLASLDAKDFPTVPGLTAKSAKSGPGMQTSAATLATMIDRTIFAVSTDETRFNLSGVYAEAHEGILRMVATDGHRLSLVDRKVEGKLLEKGVILPRKGLAEVRKVLEKAGGPEEIVSFHVEGTMAKLSCGSVELSMQLVEGEFPDYRQVIPKQGKVALTLDRQELLDALNRVSLISTERARGVKITLHAGSMELRTHAPAHGEAFEEASESLDVEYGGTDLSIGFNARYLSEVLEKVTAKNVELMMNDEASPGLIRSDADELYSYVVMPMRL